MNELIRALEKNVSGDVDASSRRRAEYSSDASNYRVVSQVVVFPRIKSDLHAILDVARSFDTSITMRGAGTSIAGNSIGPGIVVDTSRYLNRIIELDPTKRLAIVEPGVVMGSLQKVAAPHGLRFGPDPSTWARCTIGGMLGNNACGPHSLAFGKTADNVAELQAIDGMGNSFTAGNNLSAIKGLKEFASNHRDLIQREFGRFDRQISGYPLQYLLPELDGNLARALVGSEGTLVIIEEATVKLVQISNEPIMIVLGYADMPCAADAVMSVIAHGPDAIEGIDSRMVDAVRASKGNKSVAELPKGKGWLVVEISGEDRAETLERARKIAENCGALGSKIVSAKAEMAAIWRIREDGVGLAGKSSAGKQAWPGFEDAAVPPAQLGNYLREFDQLMDGHGLEGVPYGHFGDGCLHIRINFPFDIESESMRTFMFDAAHLVAKYGGSLSGEHGDGRARSELLPIMYSSEAIRALGEFKNLFDPNNHLNPGVIVNPVPLDEDVRRTQAKPYFAETIKVADSRTRGLAFAHDHGNFTDAIHKCVGIGKCRVNNSATGDFMCPSYLATKDEKDSTRGRARVLQEMTTGKFIKDGWNAPEVEESLDLCLSCKACSSDCPAGIDMAMYKSEFLFQKYRGKIRPRIHYALGWLPLTAKIAKPLAPLINAITSIRMIEKSLLALGGMDTRRSIPKFSSKGVQVEPEHGDDGKLGKIVLWTDTFSRSFASEIARDAYFVLQSVGYQVEIPQKNPCCGLTYISTGQLSRARKSLLDLLDVLYPYAEQGIAIVGLEPSCLAVLRTDLAELLPEDPRSAVVSAHVKTFAQVLGGDLVKGLDFTENTILAQPHCHQHAAFGFKEDQALLESLGAKVNVLGGCCGLAGNFGMEKGHFETSVLVAENSLLPALAQMTDDAIFLADGFSCRTQAEQLGNKQGIHLTQFLAQKIRNSHSR